MLLVSDANIFIDFEVSELTAKLFQLPHDIVVPDTLYQQELRARHPHLPPRSAARLRSPHRAIMILRLQ